ncbi:penicillin-binding protein 2, partial [Micromonospora sp. LZ34]
MPPRSDEPRRDATGSRRGSSRANGGRGTERSAEPGVGGISDARAYTPRGRTIREGAARADRDERVARPEQRRTPRSTRSGDPFRPALQVLDGGRTGATRAGRRDAAGGRSGVVRTVSPRAPFDDEPPAAPRRRPAPRTTRRPDRTAG